MLSHHDPTDELSEHIQEQCSYTSHEPTNTGCIVQVSLPCNKRVHQDVPTRWNSTFVMLDGALEYKLAFHQLHVVDRNFSRFYPTEEEWLKVQKFTTMLRPFYDLTTLFSGTNYLTTNLYFHGVWKIQKVITEEVNNLDIEVSEMAKQMSKYRTSLLPENVEVLLCARDWLYGVTASEDEEDKERLSIDFAPLVAKLTNLHV